MADWTDAPFVYRGQKKLRRGYTTGTCAAAAAAGAARMLLSGKPVSEVKLRVPEGSTLCLSLVETSLSASSCSCGVVKDSGDDPDITNGSMVCAKVSFAHSPGLVLTGGVGVGLFRDFDAIDRFIEVKSVHTPNPEAVAAYEPVKELFELCYQSLLPVYRKMAGK